MAGRMDGRVALVTGSTSGIGRGIARRFADEGATVVVTGHPDGPAEAVGGDSVVILADLTDPEQSETLVHDAIGRFGRLDTLVNNAGDPGAARDRDGPIERTGVEYWDYMYTVNVRSALCVTKAAMPHLRASGRGRIVTISSIMAVRGSGWDTYAWSKAALIGFGRSLAFSYARDHVTSNVLCLGSVVVERTAEYWESDAAARLWELNGLTRAGRPDDVAHACVWLGSDEGEYVTGAVIAVDGGMDARGVVIPR